MDEQAQAPVEVETTEAPAEEQAPEQPASEDVEAQAEPSEQIINQILSKDEPPGWVSSLEDVLDAEGKDSFKVPQSDIDALDPNAQMLLVNLRRMALSKAADAARERQEVDRMRDDIAKQRREFEQQRAELFAIFKNDAFQDYIKPPEGEAPDPFTDEGIDFRVRQASSKVLSGFMQQLQAVSEEARQQLEAKAAEIQRVQQRNELRDFIADNEDWHDFAPQIEELVKSGLNWKRAYTLAKAEAGVPMNQPQAKTVDPIRQARRAAQSRSNAGATNNVAPPQNATAEEMLRFYEKNPDMRKEAMDVLLRTGLSL